MRKFGRNSYVNPKFTVRLLIPTFKFVNFDSFVYLSAHYLDVGITLVSLERPVLRKFETLAEISVEFWP